MEVRNNFSDKAQETIQAALKFAFSMNSGYAGSEHLLWAICADESTLAAKAFSDAGLSANFVSDVIKQNATNNKQMPFDGSGMSITMEAQSVLEAAQSAAEKMGHSEIEVEHFALGMLYARGSTAARIVAASAANADEIVAILVNDAGKTWATGFSKQKGGAKNANTKAIDEFSRDLTQMASEGKLDPVIGRDKEIERAIQILSRRSKNNPVLIGEPGVGKTAIAEGLAQKILVGDVPENLEGYRVMSMDLGKMISGTKYRGDFEERIKTYIEEAQKAKNIILFIDELHTLIGAGAAEGAMDAANVLKPALGRGEIQVIGATTLSEYKKHIEKDAALERRFQPILVKETSEEDTVGILHGLRQKYEEFHNLKISDEAIKEAVSLSARYIQDRFLPDKAIDLIDEAAARVKTQKIEVPKHLKELEARIHVFEDEKAKAIEEQNFEQAAVIRDQQTEWKKEMQEKKGAWRKNKGLVVGTQDVANVVSMWTGVPVTMLTEEESARLMRLEEALHGRVVGQDEAVKAVAKAVRRSRVGIKKAGRPIGSFLFLGPTGVGKTELCKTLAQVMFQDENAVIRVDMSEYMEKHTIAKLIGSPPGYVGYDEGGQLTEKVRRKPYSIVLFDEIEKAHPDVWNALLQIMDDGRLTDGQGRMVDFKNTIIVMTSNIGARDIAGKGRLGFNSDEKTSELAVQQETKTKVMDALKNTFQPEFLNRIDEMIVFHQLSEKHIQSIAKNMVNELELRALEIGVKLEVKDSVVGLLAKKGFSPAYGARPLRRVIQSTLEDAIAEKMLEGNIKENDGAHMVATTKGDEIVLTLKANAAKQKEVAKSKKVA